MHTYKLSRKWTSVRAQWAGRKAQISMTCSLFIGGYSLPSLEQVCYLHGPGLKSRRTLAGLEKKANETATYQTVWRRKLRSFLWEIGRVWGGETLHLSSLFVSVFLSQVEEDAVIYNIPRKRCLSVYVCINRQTNAIWHWIFNSNTDLISWFLRHCC